MAYFSKLKKTVIASGGIRATNALLGILNAAILARMLGPQEFGKYAFVYAVIVIIAIPASMGIPQFVLRETAYAVTAANPGLILGIWKWAAWRVVLISVFVLGTTLLIIWQFPTAISESNVLLTGLLLVPIIAFGNLRSAALRGLGKIVIGQLPELVLRPLFFVLLLVSYYFYGSSLDSQKAILMHAAAALCAFLVGSFFLSKEVRSMKSVAQKFGGGAKFLSAMSLGLITGLTVVNNSIDIVMVKYFLEDADVGVYRSASILSGFVLFGLQVIGIVVAPRIAMLFKAGDIPTLEKLVRKSNRAAICFGILILIVLSFFGKSILQMVFGEPYIVGYAALLILAMAQTINSGFGISANLLNMTGFEQYTLKAIAVAVCCNILINYVLIQYMGIEGAALGTLISLFIYKVILSRMIKVHVGVSSGAF